MKFVPRVPTGIASAYCHARLPNAGLGNKLFIWAKAYMFSRLNGVPLRVTGWLQLQRGSILHGLDFRLYWNYFKRVDEAGWRTNRYAARHYRIIAEPAVERRDIEPGAIYEYSKVPHWSNFFGDIRDNREQVRDALLAMLTDARVRELGRHKPPVIAVNVRMGDFKKLQPNQDFAKVGSTRTPLTYFRELIEEIRKLHGTALPVEIVTDGRTRELRELLQLPNVSMAPSRSKIVDILMMSRSKVLLTSTGSTFSYWAGFLGDCALIMHPDHIHKPIRPEAVNRNFYEGPLVGAPETWPPQFVDSLRDIR
jgi:Glycosyl transferase family 11